MYGGPERTVVLKSGIEVRLDDIGGILEHDDLCESAIQFYWRYRIMGWPYQGGWAAIPARLSQVVETLEPLDRIYHPRMM